MSGCSSYDGTATHLRDAKWSTLHSNDFAAPKEVFEPTARDPLRLWLTAAGG